MAITPVNQDFNVNNGLVVLGTSVVTSSTEQTNALQVNSGAAIAQNLIVGTDAKIYGNFEVYGTSLLSSSTVAGNLTVTGEIIADRLTIQYTTVTTNLVTTDDIISTYNTTGSTGTTTGALVVGGGAGIGKDLYVGGNVTASKFFGTATNAKNLEGGATFSIPYQSTSNSTTFLSLGQDGTILGVVNQQLAWTSASGTSVGSATTASNLAGGLPGAIPYQSDVGQTAFDATGLRYVSSLTQFVTNNILVTSSASGTTIGGGALSVAGGAYFGKDVYIAELGLGAFTVAGYASFGKKLTILDYTDGSSTGTGALVLSNGGAYISQSVYIGSDLTAANARITSLGNNQLVYTDNSGKLQNAAVTYNTQTLELIGTITNALVATSSTFATTSGYALSFNTSTLVNSAVYADTATNIAGGTVNSLLYQLTPGKTTTLPIGNDNTILTVNSGTIVWGNASGASVGFATTSGFALSFNTNTLVTTAVNAYTATYALSFNTSTLVSNAVSATTSNFATTSGYALSFNTSTLVSNAVTSTYATNILGGAYGSVLYQTATNQTAALPIGGEGTVLAIVNGVFSWGNPLGFTVSTASNFNGGQAGSIPFQTGSGQTAFDDPSLNLDYPYTSNAILNVNKLFVSSTLTSISSITGALVVAGGVGIGDNLYVAGPIYSNGQQVLTGGAGGGGFVGSILAGPGISVSSATGAVTISNTGVLALTAGTDTAISSTTGTVTIWNTGTLQTITSRGSSTNQIITITNSTTATSTNTGALQVVGGIGIGQNLYVGDQTFVGNHIIPTTSTVSLGTLSNPFADLYLGPNSLNIDTVTLSAKGSTMTIAVIGSAPTYIGTPATLKIGNILINSTTNAISTTTGALQVAGGTGIGGDIRVGNSAFISNTLTVLSTLSSTSSLVQNALYVAGGVGIGKSLFVTGEAVFQNNVTFNGLTTYVLSTTTVYTDNIIELHYPNTPGNTWAVNDNNDIGFRFHYYDTQDRNAFLGRDNSTGYLEWITDAGPDNTTNVTGTNGTFRLGSIILTDTTASTTTATGALTVSGGVGIGGNLNVGGTIYRQGISVGYGYTGSIGPQGPSGPTGPQGPKGFDGSAGTAGTNGTPGATGPQGPIGYYGSAGPTGTQGLTGPQGPLGYYGSVGPTGPMGYYGSSGSFTGTTTSTVFINNLTASTSTTTGALVVAGGVGIGGNLNVGQNIITNNGDIGLGNTVTTGSTWTGGSLAFNGAAPGQALTVTSSSALQFGTNPFTIEGWFNCINSGYNQWALSRYAGSTGWALQLSGTAVTFFNYVTLFTISASTTLFYGSWTHIAVVREGTGANQTKIYVNGVLKITSICATNFNDSSTFYVGGHYTTNANNDFNGNITNVRITNGTALYTSGFTPAFPLASAANTAYFLKVASSGAYLTDSSANAFTATPLNTTPVYSALAPTVTGNASSFALHVSTSTGALEFLPNVYSYNNTPSIFTLSNDGSATTTTNALSINAKTASISTTTGALIVAGGVGVGGAVFINTTSYIAGSQIITTATIGNYAAASDTAARSTGTTSTFTISNTNASTSTNTGALVVYGGVGIGGNLNVGGIISGGGVRTSTTTTTPTPANVGDIWYYQGTDAVYRYQFDGTSYVWVDITGPNLINLYQYQGNAASTSAYLSAVSGNNFITPSVAWSAATPVALTDAATITVDLSSGMNFTCLLTSGVGATRTLANFVNPKPGQTGWIMFTQSATGNNNVKFGTNWHWPLGSTGTFSTSTVNAVDILFYTILTPTYYLGNMANRVV